MSSRVNLRLLQVGLLSIGLAFCPLELRRAIAQIIPDNTLPENSIVSPNCTNCEITGGTTRNINLFHSFEQFSIPTGGSAYFNHAINIRNIFSRITGDSVSNIDGVIRANGSTNLFLINPNGIIFHNNASLDVGGSLIATTANRINFSDGTEFSVSNPQAAALLSVTVPIGLQFGANPAQLRVQGSTLRGAAGRTLALVGGDITLVGGNLRAPQGRIELGSVAGNSRVDLAEQSQEWLLGYEETQAFREISLLNESSIDASGNRGGDIQIQGRQIRIVEGSQVRLLASVDQTGNLSVRGSELVELVGDSARSTTGLFNEVSGNASGRDRTLTVETNRLIVRNGAQISTNTFGRRRGADLSVTARESILLTGNLSSGSALQPSGLFSRVLPDEIDGTTSIAATGRGGTLTIDTERLTISNGAQISASTFSQGRAGDLIIDASESVDVTDTVELPASLSGTPIRYAPSGIFANVADEATAIGDGGRLIIRSDRLSVRNGAQIGTTAQNQGQGGTLIIDARSIRLSGAAPSAEFRSEGRSGLFVSAEPALDDGTVTTADAGTLRVSAAELIVEEGALISADNFGTGNGADVTLNVDRLIVNNGGEIGAGSYVEPNAVDRIRGSGGTITINANETIEVSGFTTLGSSRVNSRILTRAEGTGRAGNIIINDSAASTLSIELSGQGSGLFANTTENSTGDGGDISINASSINVRDGARIAVNSQGGGVGGTIRLEDGSIILNNRSLISAETVSNQGGNINLQLNNLLLLRNNSRISTNAGIEQGRGSGGNININTNIVVADPRSNNDITANAFAGTGGRVNIRTESILGLRPLSRDELQVILETTDPDELNPSGVSTSDITAISQVNPSLSGQVNLITPDIDPSRGLVELPIDVVDASQLIARGCGTGNRTVANEQGRFVVTGRGGLPANPTAPLSSDTVLGGWVSSNVETETLTDSTSYISSESVTSEPIIEAQSWIIDPQGEVALVANAQSVLSNTSTAFSTLTCQRS